MFIYKLPRFPLVATVTAHETPFVKFKYATTTGTWWILAVVNLWIACARPVL